jgi:RNA polymerase sigma factor (sigma-70 family)
LCDFHCRGCYKLKTKMTPDSELLRQFAKTNSQDAFAELARRHVNLVYSAALRQVHNDAYLAHDVAQTVFTDLARKAGSLSRRKNLTGWLYTSAHFAAAKIVRTENRRRDREEKFMREPTNESGTDFQPVSSAPETDWNKIRPTLDDAMHELKESDREAILLRYFENRQFAEVGAKLGLNENAARMRVERALEKLRAIFAKRGITTATAFASVISANAIQTAPANLAATLTTTSIAAAGTGTFTLLKIMTATKLKLAISAIVAAGAVAAFMHQRQTQNKLRAENESLHQQIVQLQADNESLSNRLATIGDSKLLTDGQLDELLRLRGEVTRLRNQQIVSQQAARMETNNPNTETIEILLKTSFVSIPAEHMQGMNVIWRANDSGVRTGLLTEQQLKAINEALQGASDANVISAPQAITINGEQARMSATRPIAVNGTNADIGTSLDVRCYFSTNSSTFNLSLNAELSELTGDPSQPNVQTIQATNQLTLFPGQTVVLQQQIPAGAWLPNFTNAPTESRSLLVFVTPQIVDFRNEPINFPVPNQNQ